MYTGLFLPLSELKAVRRRAAAQCMERIRGHSRAKGLAASAVLPSLLDGVKQSDSGRSSTGRAPRLRVLCRTMSQVSCWGICVFMALKLPDNCIYEAASLAFQVVFFI